MAVMGGEVEFKAYAPDQGQLLPSYTADALDPSDPAFFVDEVVEGLTAGRGRYRRWERAYRRILLAWLFERCHLQRPRSRSDYYDLASGTGRASPDSGRSTGSG
jgi:hypothetical protein